MEYIYELPTMWSRRRTSSRHRAEGGHSFFHFSFLGRIKDFCYIHAVPVSYLRMSNPLNCLYNLLQIWRIAPTPKNDKYQYTHFAHKINSFDTAPKKLLPSDSRLRPDRYALEKGDMSKSGAEKSRYCPFVLNSDHSSVALAVSFYDSMLSAFQFSSYPWVSAKFSGLRNNRELRKELARPRVSNLLPDGLTWQMKSALPHGVTWRFMNTMANTPSTGLPLTAPMFLTRQISLRSSSTHGSTAARPPNDLSWSELRSCQALLLLCKTLPGLGLRWLLCCQRFSCLFVVLWPPSSCPVLQLFRK